MDLEKSSGVGEDGRREVGDKVATGREVLRRRESDLDDVEVRRERPWDVAGRVGERPDRVAAEVHTVREDHRRVTGRGAERVSGTVEEMEAPAAPSGRPAAPRRPPCPSDAQVRLREEEHAVRISEIEREVETVDR